MVYFGSVGVVLAAARVPGVKGSPGRAPRVSTRYFGSVGVVLVGPRVARGDEGSLDDSGGC